MRRRLGPDPTSRPPKALLPRPHWIGYGLVAIALVVLAVLLSWRYWTTVTDAAVGSDAPEVVLLTVALAVVLFLMVHAVWRFQLERLVAWLGPIDVARFEDGAPYTAPAGRPDLVEVTTLFQDALARSRLNPVTAVPDAGGDRQFIRAVEHAGEAATGWWRVAARMAHLLFPPSVYRVTGRLLVGDARGPCAISVQVHRFPRWASPAIVVREVTWQRAAERCAHAVAAQVLPLSRECRRGPWAQWRFHALPADLFDAYQRSQSLQSENRYDEALGELYRALDLDPANLALRLEVGQLQEKLDMRLDALLTYDDVVNIGRAGNSALDWWHAGPASALPPRRGDPAVLVARYRHALLLGLGGDNLAEVWWGRQPACADKVHWGARERRRDHVRRALHARLVRYTALMEDIKSFDYDAVVAPQPPADDQEKKRMLAVFLCRAAEASLARLENDYRPRLGRRRLSGRKIDEILPHPCLQLCLIWAPLRRALAERAAGRLGPLEPARLRDPSSPGDAPTVEPRGWRAWRSRFDAWSTQRTRERAERIGVLVYQAIWVRRKIPLKPGDPDVTAQKLRVATVLQQAVKEALPHGEQAGSWHEHYNAACVYAVALLDDGQSEAPRTPQIPPGATDAERHSPAPADAGRQQKPLVTADAAVVALRRAAIDELRRAAAVSSSGFIASRRQWLVAEDPDLAALRRSDEFAQFETALFAAARPATHRPQRPHVWELVTYMSTLAHRVAREREAVWDGRAQRLRRPDGEPSLAEAQQWLRDEHEAWLLTARLAVDHKDWRTRLDVLEALEKWAGEGARLREPVPFQPYDEQTALRRVRNLLDGRLEAADVETRVADLDDAAARINKWVDQGISRCDFRMKDLGSLVNPQRHSRPETRCTVRLEALRLDGEFARWNRWLDQGQERGAAPDADCYRPLCERSAERWRTLAFWFDDTGLDFQPQRVRRLLFARALCKPVSPPPVTARASQNLQQARGGASDNALSGHPGSGRGMTDADTTRLTDPDVTQSMPQTAQAPPGGIRGTQARGGDVQVRAGEGPSDQMS